MPLDPMDGYVLSRVDGKLSVEELGVVTGLSEEDVAQSINMKGIPTWVTKEYRSAVSKGVYDLTSLVTPATV